MGCPASDVDALFLDAGEVPASDCADAGSVAKPAANTHDTRALHMMRCITAGGPSATMFRNP
jgi:hypothetical protein